jgi:hypothetical protein
MQPRVAIFLGVAAEIGVQCRPVIAVHPGVLANRPLQPARAILVRE